MNPKEVYHQRFNESQTKYEAYKNKLQLTGFARLLAFLVIAVSPFLFLPEQPAVTIILVVIGLFAFLLLIKVYARLEYLRDYYDNLVKINEQELDALDFKVDHFDEGKEFIDPHHPFSYDLDMFGKGSLFQHINRTTTNSGKKALANWITDRNINAREIQEKQRAIHEISKNLEWRQKFMANGRIFVENANDKAVFERWDQLDAGFKNEGLVHVLVILIPAITLSILGLNIAGIVPFQLVMTCIIVQWIVQMFFFKKTNYYYKYFGKQNSLLRKYEALFQLIEEHDFESELLKGDLKIKDISKASSQIKRLRKLMEAYDNRINMFAGIVLLSLFMWELLSAYRLVKWHRQCKPYFIAWHEAIEKYDVLVSLSGYAFNHPDFIYPELSDKKFDLDIQGMGHPLIPEEKCITNEYQQLVSENVTIITGANMAGKSTFLRSTGLAVIMANAGLPIFAKQMRYSPVKVYSSMRTTDSVTTDESYFFAESKRLREILDEIESGEPLFILLDEILKGTNSVDKLNGSVELLKRLIEAKTNAIVATHDLKLTEVEKYFPKKVKNLCFEIDIINDKMNFDYTLRPGVTQTMNATFILKQLGIIK